MKRKKTKKIEDILNLKLVIVFQSLILVLLSSLVIWYLEKPIQTIHAGSLLLLSMVGLIFIGIIIFIILSEKIENLSYLIKNG